MTVFLIVGLPGAGKTTRARELEAERSALRLTPDEWQMAVFDRDSPTRWRSAERAAHRDRLEGKLIEIGLRAADLGLDVVLDFGFWGTDERSALRWIAAARGLRTEVVYLPIGYDEQRRRITARSGGDPAQFEMSDAELRQWHTRFQAPDVDELRDGTIPAVPAGHASWAAWARARWPSWRPGQG
ncbi:AAA family ATPase [Microlunatus aurantiacus]|uniref:AAA family ATPase n=1 Tax=Microlunatus aurantiacus TaxID=446786 RepID=A0ABP7D397_9ACTN